MLTTDFELPASVGPGVLRGSGRVRGVFVRPWVDKSPEASSPELRIEWVTVERFSDLVFEVLTKEQIPFEGLACPYKPKKLGVRVPVQGFDLEKLDRILQEQLGAPMKPWLAP